MFKKNEIIVSVHDEESLEAVLQEEKIKTIFLLNDNIIDLTETMRKIRHYEKRVFLHVDTVQGLSTDLKGIHYVAEVLQPDGILSTRGQVISSAKRFDLLTIQRLFFIDSNALGTGIKSIKKSNPHAVEAMPGLMPKVIRTLADSIEQPVVAGGLIQQLGEVDAALQAGAVAVSLSRKSFINL
ncbi:glycerol-3-phosphate responsive antiterminator [Bacillus alkalicellulosilyticus]|uniref:glycerol-3-phosphate responsive antiterminator n=1 Tax=Alkalihalobacterium alkalicellulosilyticum TaxID=1912214 RepID=UPI000997D1AF|nr:glycerol-3-phosphate responsive antiterminator [Bacillus alkalicellulosilyticus]